MPKFPFTNYHELNLDWILKKVTALFDASEENAQTIRTYETRLTSAEQTATSAATAATAAQQLADAASENADSALSVAGTADSKADSALTAATNAADAVAGALTIAQAAQQTAGAAIATANDAAATASSLESLANTANQNATAALETAQTADQKAVAAQSAAATADQKAVAAQSAATTNAGNITTLQTDVSNLNRQISELETDFDTVKDTLNNKADVIIDSASGSIASFADGADDMPIKSLAVNIEPSQSGSGDPSPTNVRPISGRTGATIEQRGKNLLNNINPVIINGYLSMSSDGSVGDTVTIRASANDRIVVIPLKNNIYYTLTYDRKGAVTGTTDDWNVSLFYDAPNILSTGISTGINITYNGSRTFYSGQYNFAAIKIANIMKTDFSETLKASQLEIGQVSTTHETYVGSTISVDWSDEAGTVYGGTLDLVNDVLTVDSAMVDLGTLNYTALESAISTIYRMVSEDLSSVILAPVNSGTVADIICSSYKTINANSVYLRNEGISLNGAGDVCIYDPRYNTEDAVTAFKSAVSGVQLVYKLKTPTSYQLTTQQINTLLGSNNIWTDVGTVDVQYPADTKLYIDGKIAELQALVLEH